MKMLSFTSKSLIVTLWLSSTVNQFARGNIAVRQLGHHSDKSQQTTLISSAVGKSNKSHVADDIAQWDVKNEDASAGKLTSGSKSSKSVEVNSGYSSEPYEYNGGKSGKGGGNLSFEQSMSMMAIAPSSSGMSMIYMVKGKSSKSESIHTLPSGISVTGDGGHLVKASADTIMSGKAGKAIAYPHSSPDLSMPTFDVSMTLSGKAEKPLTDFFIKTNFNPDQIMMNLAGKASKTTEYETTHIETTTVTYENSGDVEMIKAKSSKSDGYAYAAEIGSDKGSSSSKAGKPSSSSNSTSSASDDSINSTSPIATGNDFVSGATLNYSSKSNKYATISPGLSASGSSKSAKHPTVSPTITPGLSINPTVSSSNPTVSSSTLGTTINDTGFDSGERPEDSTSLLTLAPTPSMDLKSNTASATSGSHSSPSSSTSTYFPTSPKDNRHTPSSETPTTNTYEPTSLDEPSSLKPSNEAETSIAINPFALSLHTNSASPNLDPETVRAVTKEHLVHSFRNYASGGYVVKRLNLMLLDPEGERRLLSARGLQSFDEYELIFGGILYFQTGTNTPSMADIDLIVKSSFTGTRLDYYVNLLQEAGMGVGAVSYDEDVVKSHDESASGRKWRTISVSLGGAVGGLALVATGIHVYYKKHRMMLKSEMCDIESGRFVIKLKDEAEVEEFPGLNICQSTVANTENDTHDDRSVPSTVQHSSDDDMPSLSSRSLDAIEQEKYDPRISPLEEPPTRYISVFTVKKDVQGKSLEEIDLRGLAISYLSKMMKKFPNTFLLPYDKESTLNPITSIRNIPDGLEDLEQYVGNARVDVGSGKVMFNLRVESDMPVSKMKGSKNNHASMPPLPPVPSEFVPGQLGKERMQETDEAYEETKGFEDVTI